MLRLMEKQIQNVAILRSLGLTSYLKPIGHRISIRSFLQSSHRTYRIGGACTEAPGHASLGELQDSPLWGSSGYQDLHRWGSLHGSFRLGSSGYWAGGTSGCCGGVLKVQPPQVLQSGSSCMDRPIGFSALAPAHFLCSNCLYLTRITRFQSNE